MKNIKVVRTIEKNAVRLLTRNFTDTKKVDEIIEKTTSARKKIKGLIALN